MFKPKSGFSVLATMMRHFILLLLSVFAIASCTEVSDFQVDYQYDYYPLQPGHTTYYEVDSVKYNSLFDEGRDTFHWEFKVVIADSFTTLDGHTAFRLERYQREPGSSNWGPPKTGMVLRKENRIEYQMDNLRLIPFVFPPKEGKTWNGAAFIPDNDTFAFYRDWENTFEAVGESHEVQGSAFAETALVQEVDEDNLLEYKFSESRYARDIGLIERTQFNLRFVGSVIPDEPWEEKATNGFIVHQKLTHYEPGG